jgi:hypothetical protein
MNLIDAYVDRYYDEEQPRRQLYKPKIERVTGTPKREATSVTRRVNPVSRRVNHVYGTFLRKKRAPQHYSQRFAPYYAKLELLATDRSLLVDGSAPPSILALAYARAILQQLETESLEPTRIVASADGGVAICIVNGEKYSDIECLNSEEILGVISNRRDTPVVWEVNPTPSGLAGAVARIRDFLIGGAPRPYDPERQAR